MGAQGAPLLVAGGHDELGCPLDVLVHQGRIVATGPGAHAHALTGRAERLQLPGLALLPAPAEPHAHLDKAFLGPKKEASDATRGGGGEVGAAVRAMSQVHASMTVEAVAARALAALREGVRHGFTAVRSHVDVGGALGTRGVAALVGLRRELQGTLDLQLVAMPVQPVSGPDGARGRAWLEAALGAGADIVGGCPWLEEDPVEAVDFLTATAAGAGVPIDLHMDECTDQKVLTIERFALRVGQLGLGGRANASHCVSLGQQPAARARALARQLAEAGIAVVALPQTNLWLQGRGSLTMAPRALAPVALLDEAGVAVCAGGDNWRDYFNPLGRADPLETAALLAAAGHIEVRRAYSMVSEAARSCLGLEPARLKTGDQADFLAIRASGAAEAVAGASEARMVFHRGAVVARTDVSVHGTLWS